MKDYKQILKTVFQKLETDPLEWDILEPDWFEGDKPIYSKPNFKRIEPYYEEFPTLAEYHAEGYPKNCQLCGHHIENVWIIIHIEKEIMTHVGNVCVKKYLLCDVKKETKEIVIRKAFAQWVPNAKKQFWKMWWDNNKWLPPVLFHLFEEFNDNPKTLRKIKKVCRDARTHGFTLPKGIDNELK